MLAALRAGGYYSLNSQALTAGMTFITDEDFTSTARGTSIRFGTTFLQSTAETERMRISPEGNVGIGTTNPQAKLDVTGDIHGIMGSSAERARRYIYNPTSWSSTGTIPGVLAASQAVIIGEFVYLFGGFASGATNVIYRSSVYDPTTWSSVGTLPATLASSTATVIGDYVYLFGGYNGTSAITTIYRAPVANPASNPIPWTTVGNLPGNLAGSSLAVIGDYVYLFGG